MDSSKEKLQHLMRDTVHAKIHLYLTRLPLERYKQWLYDGGSGAAASSCGVALGTPAFCAVYTADNHQDTQCYRLDYITPAQSLDNKWCVLSHRAAGQGSKDARVHSTSYCLRSSPLSRTPGVLFAVCGRTDG